MNTFTPILNTPTVKPLEIRQNPAPIGWSPEPSVSSCVGFGGFSLCEWLHGRYRRTSYHDVRHDNDMGKGASFVQCEAELVMNEILTDAVSGELKPFTVWGFGGKRN